MILCFFTLCKIILQQKFSLNGLHSYAIYWTYTVVGKALLGFIKNVVQFLYIWNHIAFCNMSNFL